MTSKDPVGAGIFYRDVPLMPAQTRKGVIKPLSADALPLITWRLRDISKAGSAVVLKDMPTCANCHSFSSDGQTMGMDMDGPSGDKGAYGLAAVKKDIVITYKDIITWNSFKYKRNGQKTIGFFSRVSPDGQHVVSTVNESIFVVNYPDFQFLQSFYATRGILAVYSKADGSMEPLPGADDPNYVHCNPCWSPDGKNIVFSRAKAMDNYPGRDYLVDPDKRPAYAGDPRENQIRYDLYKIAFNNGKGGIAEPVKGASSNGMSNSFAKWSPDGKWIVFVQSQNGQLMRPDSKLFIIAANGGDARRLNCNLSTMNSWHSFSPNSRWLVFSSKGFSPFTQMFLTHLDENGNDSPAIMIPNSTADNRAVNIPEFLNNSPDAITSISAPTQESYRYFKKGLKLSGQKKYAEAMTEFEKSKELNPYYSRLYTSIGNVMWETDKLAEAVSNYAKAIELEPEDFMAHANLGSILLKQGNKTEAEVHLAQALRINPHLASAQHNMGVLLIVKGKYPQAIEHLNEAIKIEPNAKIHNDLAAVLFRENKFEQAIKHFSESLQLEPDLAETHNNLAYVLINRGRFDEAVEQLREVVHLKDDWAGPMNQLARYLAFYKTAKFHNPMHAIELAQKACELTGYEQPSFLETLSVAYAAAGEFEKAISTNEKALKLAKKAGKTQLVQNIQQCLALYKAGKSLSLPLPKPAGK